MAAMHQWWLSAQSQGGKHLVPLLALLERGAGAGVSVQFEERPDEYDFWNRYFKVPGDEEKPFINPLTLRRGEQDFPHSNAATIRKNTFALKWKAAELSAGSGGEAMWSLSSNYASIFREKGLTKGGYVARVPAIDLASIMLRKETFPDSATSDDLIGLFRSRFKQRDPDFDAIFEVVPEPPEQIFTSALISEGDYDDAMAASVTVDAAAPSPLPGGVAVVPTALEDADDAILVQVRELLALNSSGIIIRGVPGTGKTWYAHRIAASLVGDPLIDIFRVQFHPSYGYEDFVEGYRPDEASKSGFKVFNKVFLDACTRARELERGYVAFIIDEINRGDPARIFGDLLTYIEHGYRGESFSLAYSGTKVYVPANLVVIGTMNPYDRSIAQLDSAFLRRFDYIDMPPSVEMVGFFLEKGKGFTPQQVEGVQRWFEGLQRLLPQGIGHTYFKDVKRPEQLRLIWRYRMWPACEAALEFDLTKQAAVKASFDGMFANLVAQPDVTVDTNALPSDAS
jgi:5-methylcytosine-specific restriction enzyme B